LMMKNHIGSLNVAKAVRLFGLDHDSHLGKKDGVQQKNRFKKS